MAAKLIPKFKDEAEKARKLGALKGTATVKRKADDGLYQYSQRGILASVRAEPIEAAKLAAATFMVSTHAVYKAQRLLLRAPDLAECVSNGSLSLTTAAKMLKIREMQEYGILPSTHAYGPTQPVVYFIQARNSLRVKIGFSKNVLRRYIELAGGQSSEELVLLGCVNGDKELEASLHKRFEPYRIFGEWFNCSQEILDYIAEVCSAQNHERYSEATS